jgi:hypothetical protein
MDKLTNMFNLPPFMRKTSATSQLKTTHLGKQNYTGPYDDGPIPTWTIHSVIMAVFVSMGGFIL